MLIAMVPAGSRERAEPRELGAFLLHSVLGPSGEQPCVAVWLPGRMAACWAKEGSSVILATRDTTYTLGPAIYAQRGCAISCPPGPKGQRKVRP